MTGLAAAFTVLCAVFAALYDVRCRSNRYRSAFWIKGIAGLGFIAVGLSLAMLQPEFSYARRIVFGLVFGLIGDQLLALRYLHPDRRSVFFLSGMLAFAAGHVMYLAAMLQLDGGTWLFALLLLAPGLAAAAWYILSHAVRLGGLIVPGVCYIVLVVSVAAMAASLLLQGQGTRALLLTLGGVCFAASDCVLSVQTFGPEKTVRRSAFVHAAYYTAQLLIAWSIAA